MIDIKNLKKSYDNIPILEGVDLSIKTGEIYGLVGMSGAGKSTLLDCIGGLQAYDSGSIKVDGLKLEELNQKELRKFHKEMGMIFQNFSLVSRKSVYKNIALPMECWKINKNEINRKVKELAELVGLEDKLDSRPEELSGGQKQRVAIARALTMNPKYILCDECTSSLDPRTTLSILNLLSEIRNKLGITIIVVTHEMDVVKQLCDRISILENGTIVETGNVSDVFFNNSKHLNKLLGEDKRHFIDEGLNISFDLTGDKANEPILYNLALKLQKQYVVIDSESNNLDSSKRTSFTININELDEGATKDYFDSKNIKYRIYRKEDRKYVKQL